MNFFKKIRSPILKRHFWNSFSTVQRKPETQAFNESFLSGTNSAYIEGIFEKWLNDKSSVHSSWNAYFTNLLKGYEPEETFQMPPSISPSIPAIDLKKTQKKSILSEYISEILRLELMIQGFQFRGNEMADLDPLSTLINQENKNPLFFKI